MVTVLACVLLFFSLAAYRREGSSQLRVLLVISGLFLVKGLFLSLWIFANTPGDVSDILVISLLIDFVILLLLFITGFRGAKKEPRKRQGEQEGKSKKGQEKSAPKQ